MFDQKYHSFYFFEKILHFEIDQSTINELVDFTYQNIQKGNNAQKSLRGGEQLRNLEKNQEFISRFKPSVNCVFEAASAWLDDYKVHYLPKSILDQETTSSQSKARGIQFILESIWINYSKPGAYNMMHTHPNGNISGVIYLKAPKDCGAISFVNPYSFFCAAERTYQVLPKEGMGLLFNSRLPHVVDVNHSEEDRISMSFNMRFTDIPIGKTGKVK